MRERLRDARAAAGMTQQAVADRLGIGLRYYQKIEAGTSTVANADKVAASIRTELFYQGRRREVKVFRRRDRLFLERVEEDPAGAGR